MYATYLRDDLRTVPAAAAAAVCKINAAGCGCGPLRSAECVSVGASAGIARHSGYVGRSAVAGRGCGARDAGRGSCICRRQLWQTRRRGFLPAAAALSDSSRRICQVCANMRRIPRAPLPPSIDTIATRPFLSRCRLASPGNERHE